MKKFKIFGTLAESTRLASSLAIVVFFASTLEPQIFVVMTLCISSANLVASVSSLGIPIWINLKFNQLNLLRARSAILFSTFVSLPLLVIFSNYTFLNDANADWGLLLISEFLLAGPIAFENRLLLSEMKDRKYLAETLIQTSSITIFLIMIAFFGHSVLFISYFVFVLSIYLKNHIRMIHLSGVPARLVFRTYAESLSVGSIALVANFFDNLPIICAGSLLKPVDAATTQLVLRITSVSLIPTNALASVTFAEKAKSKSYDYIKSHLLFSISSSLAIVLSIFLILKYFIFFENYPNLTNFLWYQIISVIARSFLITLGNYLTIENRNHLRIRAFGVATTFFLSIIFLINLELLPLSARNLLFGYVLAEILVFFLIYFHAKRVKD